MDVKLKLGNRPLLLATVLYSFINFSIIGLNRVENVIYITVMNFLILIHLLLFFSIGTFKNKEDSFIGSLLRPYLDTFYLILFVYVLSLFTSGILWEFTWLSLTLLPLFFSNMYILYTLKKEGSFNDIFFEKRMKKYKKIISKITIFVVIIFFLLILSPYILIWSDYTLTDNKSEINELVDEITMDAKNDTEKTLALLSWFDRGEGKQENFSNIYFRERETDNEILLNVANALYIFSKSPHFCCRGQDEIWVFCAKCGRCEEVSNLFNVMGYYAGLDVRKVVCDGEDHVWNEVNIGGEWIILDATEVNLPDSTGFNLSRNFMENKVKGEWSKEGRQLEEGNVSYVYAEYLDGRPTEDITYRYTNTINITVRCVDSNNESLANVSISVYSYNSPKTYCYNRILITEKTDETGCSTFILGGGDYRFKAIKDNITQYKRDSFSEDIQNHSVTIKLNS